MFFFCIYVFCNLILHFRIHVREYNCTLAHSHTRTLAHSHTCTHMYTRMREATAPQRARTPANMVLVSVLAAAATMLVVVASAAALVAMLQVSLRAPADKIHGQALVYAHPDVTDVTGNATLAYHIQYASPSLLKVDFTLLAGATLLFSSEVSGSTILFLCQLPCQNTRIWAIADLKNYPSQHGYSSMLISYPSIIPQAVVSIPMAWTFTNLSDGVGELLLYIDAPGVEFILTPPRADEYFPTYNSFTILLNTDQVPT